MKLIPPTVAIASLFLAACSTPPPRPPPPSTRSTSTALHPRFAIEIENRTPAPVSSSPHSSWPVRRAPAFTSATLPARLLLSPAEIVEMRNDIRRWIAHPLIPSGKEISLYQSGVSTLDHWLHYGPNPREYPPNTTSYYQMIYRDGLPVEVYRHDVSGRRLSLRVYYSENMIPVCSINYDADGKPKGFAHLTYEPSGLIRQIVTLDERGEPVWGICHAHEGIYARTETITYKMKSFGDRSHHTLHEEDYVYRVEKDGSRKQINRGAKLWRLTRLSAFGVKPFYPLPDGFVVPEFDRRGTPISKQAE